MRSPEAHKSHLYLPTCVLGSHCIQRPGTPACCFFLIPKTHSLHCCQFQNGSQTGQHAEALDSSEIVYLQVLKSEGFLTSAVRQERDFLSYVEVDDGLEWPN